MTTSNQTQDTSATGPTSNSTTELTTTSTASSQQPDTSTTQPQSTPSTPKKCILIINGPNLNLLGYREPSIYGSTKLADIEAHLATLATQHGITIQTYQSNHEGAIVDRLHEAFWANLAAKNGEQGVQGTVDGIIINPGAYTHTSVALRDALAGTSLPFVECHISNVHAREAFRHKSFLSDKAEAVIAGLGVFGYVAALEWWCWKWKGGNLEDAGR